MELSQIELVRSGLFLPSALSTSKVGWTISKEWENAIMTRVEMAQGAAGGADETMRGRHCWVSA